MGPATRALRFQQISDSLKFLGIRIYNWSSVLRPISFYELPLLGNTDFNIVSSSLITIVSGTQGLPLKSEILYED